MSDIVTLEELKTLQPRAPFDKDYGDVNSILHGKVIHHNIKELDYIGVHGDNQIELGIPAKSPIKIEMKIEMLTNTKGQCLFGFSDEHLSSSYWKYMYIAVSYDTNGYWCFGYGNQYLNPRNSNVAFEVNTPYVIEANFENGNSYFKVDGETKLSTTLAYDMNYDYNIPLLCRRMQNSATGTQSNSYSNARLYYFKLWKNEELLFDLVPVIIDDVVGAFKNKVDNALIYGNNAFYYFGFK